MSDMATQILEGLTKAMLADDKVLCLGNETETQGGLFGATRGLVEDFGPERVLTLPDNPRAQLATALGMAHAGLRPVLSLNFGDDVLGALDILCDDIATLRYRSGGQNSCPMVLRLPSGGGIGAGPAHSRDLARELGGQAGLRVVACGSAATAKSLIEQAIRSDDPVVLLEPKSLYRERAAARVAELDRALVLHQGDDLSLFAWGAAVPVAREAVEQAAELGIEIELIDLVSINPLDEETILSSLRKTGRGVIVEEGSKRGGIGAEVAAVIAERAIDSLEAPLLRVAGWNTPLSRCGEELYRPDCGRVMRAVEQVIDF
ncbi:MAG: transketolase C-terminal domain-containing protein [Planctomycetota bacterium]